MVKAERLQTQASRFRTGASCVTALRLASPALPDAPSGRRRTAGQRFKRQLKQCSAQEISGRLTQHLSQATHTVNIEPIMEVVQREAHGQPRRLWKHLDERAVA